jgi:uncharacterized protein (DUF488 family)
MAIEVFTIGHSNHSIERFIELLQMHGVKAIADVRSSPYSRFNPAFNREVLKLALDNKEILYVFLGKELGARSKDPNCYENGRVQYKKLAQTALFKQGIDRVLNGAKNHRIALLCAEQEPLDCHRTLLISRELETQEISVCHIHSDGRLETQAEVLDRLIKLVGLAETDLFRSREDIIEEAYARQEQKIAYVEKGHRADTDDKELK